MALSDNINTREMLKFRERSGEAVVAVVMEGETGLLDGIKYDDVQVAYPTAVKETYSFYLAAVLVATIEVTYSDSTKVDMTRARRV